MKCQQRKTVFDGLLFYCLKNIQLQASSTISGKRSKNRKTPSTQNVKKSQNKILSKYKMSLQFPLSFSTKIPSIKFPPTQFFTSLKGWRDKKRQILILLSKIRFYQFHLLHYYDKSDRLHVRQLSFSFLFVLELTLVRHRILCCWDFEKYFKFLERLSLQKKLCSTCFLS